MGSNKVSRDPEKGQTVTGYAPGLLSQGFWGAEAARSTVQTCVLAWSLTIGWGGPPGTRAPNVFICAGSAADGTWVC